MKYDLVGIGNALVDIEVQVDDAFIDEVSVTKGGTVSYTHLTLPTNREV